MERPASERLLAEIAAGRVDVAIISKVDRLTRPPADLAEIVECWMPGLSVTQAFNTTSGRRSRHPRRRAFGWEPTRRQATMETPVLRERRTVCRRWKSAGRRLPVAGEDIALGEASDLADFFRSCDELKGAVES